MPRPVVAAFAAVAALFAVASSATADAVSDFYKGKTVTVLIGFGPGGGNDAWARTVGAHIGKYLPGNPGVVPQNMPGAGGLKMTKYLYAAAPKDGAVFGLTNPGIPVEPLLGGKGADFDALKINWIGSPTIDTTVCAARSDSPVKTMDDLL
jgi:tripartite-type tricarboxylate transporter receptor subunit TctC